MRGFAAGLRDRCQVKIIGSRGDGRLRFNSRSESGRRPAGKEWMNFTVGSVYINKKNFTITGFRKSGSDAGGESRSSDTFPKASHTHQLWFMGNSM